MFLNTNTKTIYYLFDNLSTINILIYLIARIILENNNNRCFLNLLKYGLFQCTYIAYLLTNKLFYLQMFAGLLLNVDSVLPWLAWIQHISIARFGYNVCSLLIFILEYYYLN